MKLDTFNKILNTNNRLLITAYTRGGKHFGIFLVAVYFSEEILNGFIGNNLAGSIILVLSLGYLLQGSSTRIVLPKIWLWCFFSLTMFSFIASISPKGCYLEQRGLLSLILIWLLLISFRITFPARLVLDSIASKFFLQLIILALVLDYFGVGIMLKLFGASRSSGPYFEPSHLAFYLLPFISFRLLSQPRDYLSWTVLFVSFIIAPSSTLLVGVLGIFGLIMARNELPGGGRIKLAFLVVVSLFVVLISLDVINITKSFDRFTGLMSGYSTDDRQSDNLSSLVWLNGWSQAMQTLYETNGLGTGFNQMGCGRFENVGSLSPLIFAAAGVVLNSNDGSFLASKMIAELGFVGIIAVMGLTVLSFKAIYRLKDVNCLQGSMERTIQSAQAAGALCVLSYLFVRGSGYFQLPILVALSLLTIPRNKEKVKTV